MGFTPQVMGSFLPVRVTALPPTNRLRGKSLLYTVPGSGVWLPPPPCLDPDGGVLPLFLGARDGKKSLSASGTGRPFVWANMTDVRITEK